MTPDLTTYDIILINTSGGKDSQTMLRLVTKQAAEQGVSDRVTVVHADLGRVEWPGTKALAETQANHYGFDLAVVKRPQGDLLEHVVTKHLTNLAKGEVKPAWPGPKTRFCTSEHKRGQVRKLMTALVRKLDLDRPARILNCMGLRAAESTERSKKQALSYDASASGKGTVRQVWDWLPILDWSTDEVWADIHASEVPYHPVYDQGMDRLSCSFCVFAPRHKLVRAAQLAPELAERYVAVEIIVGHRFTDKFSIADVVAEAKAA